MIPRITLATTTVAAFASSVRIDVPFLVEFLQPLLDGRSASIGVTCDVLVGIALNLFINLVGRCVPNTVGSRR